jgi:hypothetical protein
MVFPSVLGFEGLPRDRSSVERSRLLRWATRPSAANDSPRKQTQKWQARALVGGILAGRVRRPAYPLIVFSIGVSPVLTCNDASFLIA